MSVADAEPRASARGVGRTGLVPEAACPPLLAPGQGERLPAAALRSASLIFRSEATSSQERREAKQMLKGYGEVPQIGNSGASVLVTFPGVSG